MSAPEFTWLSAFAELFISLHFSIESVILSVQVETVTRVIATHSTAQMQDIIVFDTFGSRDFLLLLI